MGIRKLVIEGLDTTLEFSTRDRTNGTVKVYVYNMTLQEATDWSVESGILLGEEIAKHIDEIDDKGTWVIKWEDED